MITKRRPAGRIGIVACALAALALSVTAPPEAAARHLPRVRVPTPERAPARVLPFPSAPETLSETDDAPGVIAIPPLPRSAPRPVTVMLHGMCDEPENECPWFQSSVTRNSWLLCPRASLRCQGGGSIWSGKGFEETVERSVQRAKAEFPGTIDDAGGRTLVGFSLGAIRGMDLAHDGRGRYSGVILIGAKIFPNAERLRRAGVQRIVLAAGERDMMKWQMVGQAKRLARQRFPVAFMSMGPVGHWFPRDMDQRRALDWVHGNDAAFVPNEPGELAWVPSGE